MRLNKGILVGLITLLVSNFATAQVAEMKKKLEGRWLFNGFEVNKETMTNESKKMIEIAEKKNQGMMISLHTDGMYRIFQVDKGHKSLLRSGKYKLTQNGRFFSIDGLSGTIESVDAKVLKLANEKQPTMKFLKSS